MKNKKLNRLLLPAVLLIWLAVIFRWDSSGEAHSVFVKAQNESLLQEDSLLVIPELTLAYRDPFLEKPFFARPPARESGLVPQLIQATFLEQKKALNSFLYKGNIEVDGQKLALLSYNSTMKYVAPGEKLADWEVASIEWNRLCLTQKKQAVCLQTAQDTLM